jgi:diacylglycerol diphosphate phosphatase/phosphatidate phosphatase
LQTKNIKFTGLSYALSTSTLFTCIIKVLIGGLRPNFYEQCRPAVYLDALVASSSTTASQQSLVQYGTVEQLCTNTDKFSLYEVQKSFPSGHASSAFAGFVFLTLWLSAHFKTLGRPHENTTKKPQGPSVATTATTTTTIISLNEALHDPEKATAPPKPLSDQHFGAVPHWKLVLFAAPLCVATALSLSKVRDGWHHPVDVVCGAGIGTFFAVVAYKMVFWSVWDAKDNHVPRRSGVRGES